MTGIQDKPSSSDAIGGVVGRTTLGRSWRSLAFVVTCSCRVVISATKAPQAAFVPVTTRLRPNAQVGVPHPALQFISLQQQSAPTTCLHRQTFLPAQWKENPSLYLSSSEGNEGNNTVTNANSDNLQSDAVSASTKKEEEEEEESRRSRFRKRVQNLANRMVVEPVKSAAPMPKAIVTLLRDATLGAVDMAVEEVLSRRSASSASTTASTNTKTAKKQTVPSSTPFAPPNIAAAAAAAVEVVSVDNLLLIDELIDQAFAPMEHALSDMETSLARARGSLADAKLQASQAMQVLQAAALAQTQGAAAVVELAEEAAERKVLKDLYENADDVASAMSFEDIDFDTTEMAPPFLDEAQCLIPGEPVVRVEKAPENSRRIFAGIDIPAGVEEVWRLLTDYDNLQNVVPNLVVNDVLSLYDGTSDQRSVKIDGSLPEEDQCRTMAQAMKGALLKQVGGAKVAGINFSARTTLEVREWPQGMPDFAHYKDEVWEGKSRDDRAKDDTQLKLQRYRFPRPFAISSLPTKDISMQSMLGDDGEFRLYQGVWRMQPLPGCASPGKSAMRLTYAVEISPRAYLPVQLVEGRIVRDLCTNLIAIRNCAVSENDAVVPA